MPSAYAPTYTRKSGRFTIELPFSTPCTSSAATALAESVAPAMAAKPLRRASAEALES